MKILKRTLAFAAAFLLQGTLLNAFSLFHQTPNLLLCLVIIFSLLYDDAWTVILGGLFGFFTDLCFMPAPGIAASGMVLICGTVFLFKKIFNRESLLSLLFIGGCCVLLYQLYLWCAGRLLGIPAGFGYWLRLQPLYLALNLAVLLVLYLFLINKAVRHRKDRKYR